MRKKYLGKMHRDMIDQDKKDAIAFQHSMDMMDNNRKRVGP